MKRKIYTVEELMSDDSFLDYCLHNDPVAREFWQKEMALLTDQQAVFAEAAYMVGILYGKLDEAEIKRQIDKVRKQIGSGSRVVSQSGETDGPLQIVSTAGEPDSINNKPRRKYMLYGIAAGVMVLLSVYLFKYALPHETAQKIRVASFHVSSGMGERKKIMLPDGTSVILNSNSSITYTDSFNIRNRELLLTGEAFFQVAKDPSRPFIVHSGDFSTTALGTAFYIYAAGVCDSYRVDLIEGKVQIGNGGKTSSSQKMVLLAGQRAQWQPEQSVFTGSICDTSSLRQWINGRLSFKEMQAGNVFRLLEQWYAVTIAVQDKKRENVLLTGDYNNEPLDNILKVICFSMSCHYRIDGNKIIIEP